MFFSLRLRTGHVASNKEKGSIHDSSTSEHGGHENVMSWTIYKGHMSLQLHFGVTVLALGVVFLGRAVGLVALRVGTDRALEDLAVGIA